MPGTECAALIGKYFGNTALNNAPRAAGAARMAGAAFHLQSELEQVTTTKAGSNNISQVRHEFHPHSRTQKKVSPYHLSEDELVQVLFTKMDKVPFPGPEHTNNQ